MSERTNRAILHRIRQQLKALGKTARAASIEAGLGPDAIRDLERKPKVIPRIDTIESLAPVLEMTPTDLAFGPGAGAATEAAQGLKVIGEVAAGLWLEVDGPADERTFGTIPVPAHPSYPLDAQYGLIVQGTSMNRVAEAGDILQCLDIGMSGLEPIDGDIVIVERRRAQAGQKEVTAKRWRRRGRIIELAPDSTDQRWNKPLVFDPKKAGEDQEVAVIAIVIGVYKPLRRAGQYGIAAGPTGRET